MINEVMGGLAEGVLGGAAYFTTSTPRQKAT